MLYIIYKDLYQSRKTILLYFLIGLVFIVSSFLNDMGIAMSAAFIFLLVYGVVVRNEYTEDKNKGYSLLRTLPIKPCKIILSKYLTALLLATTGVLFYFIIAKLSGGRIVIDGLSRSVVLIGAGFALVFTGVLYMFIFKYGAAKAINISRLFFFGFFFLPGIISSLVKYIPKPGFIESGKLEIVLEKFFANLLSSTIAIVGVALIIYVFTMIVSINQFKKNKIM